MIELRYTDDRFDVWESQEYFDGRRWRYLVVDKTDYMPHSGGVYNQKYSLKMGQHSPANKSIMVFEQHRLDFDKIVKGKTWCERQWSHGFYGKHKGIKINDMGVSSWV